jgi:hypothetical protein
VETLQDLLIDIFGIKLPKYGSDGKYGSEGGETWEAVRKMQQKIGTSATGKYDGSTRTKLETHLKTMMGTAQRNDHPEAAEKYRKYLNKLPTAMFAKGTLGTSRDQWAITDESWIGEEITLAAGKNGQLQYLKKGSAVMPADISANLVEWGQLDPSKMNIGDMSGGIQIMSNYVSKPELNLSFDSLVHVDHCDEGTLKDLEKMVDTKIDQFSKQMNYAIKRFK